MPLYVRAGAIIPFGPLKQYTAERVDGPLTMRVYPGADGECTVYEDDGMTFDYRQGAWMGLRVSWSDRTRVASVRLADGSRMIPPGRRTLDFALRPDSTKRRASSTAARSSFGFNAAPHGWIS